MTRSLAGLEALAAGNSAKLQSEDIPWPAPLSKALYGLIGEIVKIIEPHTEADPVALLVQLLVAFGNSVGRNPHFNVEADRHGLNLFTVLVGTSSKGRKGTSWGYVNKLFQSVDPDWINGHVSTGLSSGEGLIWAVRDPTIQSEPVREKGGHVKEYQAVIVDEGVKDKRLLVQEAEFSSTLKVLRREGNTLSAVIRNSWDTGNLSSLTKNNPARATGAHISIIGHVTKHELLRYLNNTEVGNGFANRFLFICVKRSKYLPEGGDINSIDLVPLIDDLKLATMFAKSAGEIQRDEETRELWRKIYPVLAKDQPGLFGAVTGRAEAQVTRLSCLYALLDLSEKIRKEHLEAALDLWNYAESSARFIFSQSTGDQVADKLLKSLKDNPEGMSRTQIRDLFQRHKSAEEIDSALVTLAEANLAKLEREGTANGTGRSTERWFAM